MYDMIQIRRCIRVSTPTTGSGALCHDFDGLDLLAQDPQSHHQLRLVHLGHLIGADSIGSNPNVALVNIKIVGIYGCENPTNIDNHRF